MRWRIDASDGKLLKVLLRSKILIKVSYILIKSVLRKVLLLCQMFFDLKGVNSNGWHLSDILGVWTMWLRN
jgi:hypothetical protein